MSTAGDIDTADAPASDEQPRRSRAGGFTQLGTAVLLLVLLAPIPFGANRPFWWCLAGALTAILLVFYALMLLKRREPPGVTLWKVLAIGVPFGYTCLWVGFQVLPGIGPGLASPWWSLAAEALDQSIPGRITLSPAASLDGLIRYLTYAGVFLLCLELGRDRRFAERTVSWIAYGGLAYALYGLAMHWSGAGLILWFPKWAYADYLTSTFVNRNSYATYAALGLVCASSLLIVALRDVLGQPMPLRRRIVTLIEVAPRRAAWPLLATAALAIALLQTGSRMGALSALVGLLVLLAAAVRGEILRPRHGLWAAGGLAIAGLAMVALSGGAVIDRLDTATLSTDAAVRGELFSLTLKAIEADPLLGTGLGTFADAFALYRPAGFDSFLLPNQAHNSYLENALELGVPTTILLLASLAAMAEATFMGLRRRKRGRILPALGLAALATVAVHSAVDFSLEIPAVTITFAALMGVATAQSFRSRRRAAVAAG